MDNLNKWIQLFDENHYQQGKNEPEELTNVIILFLALQKEFKKIETYLNDKLQTLKRKHKNNASQKSEMEIMQKNQLSPKAENRESLATSPILSKHRSVQLKKGTSRDSVLSMMDPEETSLNYPIINNFVDSESKFSDDDILDSSVIGITPNVKILKKKKKSKYQKTKSKNSSKSTTLSQVFSKMTTEKKVNRDLSSMMDIDEILGRVEEECAGNKTSISAINDDFQNKTLSDYDMIIRPKSNSPKPKHNFKETVRGNEKKKLKGWSCKECEKFYMAMNLSETELINKMNECSKHRSRFKPDEETIPGFWDMSIPPTPEKNKKTQHRSTQESIGNDSTIFDFYKQ